MNFQSLSYFIEITKDMNFTRTAERLHTSQQCLSGHIKRLEEHYGVKLFDRKPKLILTYAGEQLLASSEKILAMESDIYDKLYNISSEKRGRIRLQISPQRSLAYAPRIFPVFSQLHPNVDMELIESASTGLAKKSLREKEPARRQYRFFHRRLFQRLSRYFTALSALGIVFSCGKRSDSFFLRA